MKTSAKAYNHCFLLIVRFYGCFRKTSESIEKGKKSMIYMVSVKGMKSSFFYDRKIAEDIYNYLNYYFPHVSFGVITEKQFLKRLYTGKC